MEPNEIFYGDGYAIIKKEEIEEEMGEEGENEVGAIIVNVKSEERGDEFGGDNIMPKVENEGSLVSEVAAEEESEVNGEDRDENGEDKDEVRHSDNESAIGSETCYPADKPYQCEPCYQYSTHDPTDLTTHLKRMHGGEKKPFTCDMCDFTANSEPDLNAHRSSKHEIGEFRYRCCHCDYKTNKLSQAKQHTLTHSVKKPFRCDKCGYRAKRKGQVTEHKLRRHPSSATKPFQCEECDYETYIKGDLTQHVKNRHKM